MTTTRAPAETSTVAFDLESWFGSLRQQRNNIQAMLEHACADTSSRSDLWPEIRREIISHHRIDIASATRTLSGDLEVQDLVKTHEAMAATIMALVATLDRLDPDSADWRDDIRELQIVFSRQSATEQDQLVPHVRRLLGVGPPVDVGVGLEGEIDLDDECFEDGLDGDTLVFPWPTRPLPPPLGTAVRLGRWIRTHPTMLAAIALAAGAVLVLRFRGTASRS